jgi:hypothetical protein
VRNTVLIVLYFWGVPPEKLQPWYRARRRRMQERGDMAV